MSSEFDPYHKWLGISPREQPPNHYRLLAIDVFEDDKEVIDASANRQMSYLQELASGPNVKHAQALLNKVAAARVCLLDNERKQQYDEELKKKSGRTATPSARPASQRSPAVEPAVADRVVVDTTPRTVGKKTVRRKAVAAGTATSPVRERRTAAQDTELPGLIGATITTTDSRHSKRRSGGGTSPRGNQKQTLVVAGVSLAAVAIVATLGTLVFSRSNDVGVTDTTGETAAESPDEDDFPTVAWTDPGTDVTAPVTTPAEETAPAGEGTGKDDNAFPQPGESAPPVVSRPDPGREPPKPAPPSDETAMNEALDALNKRDIARMKAKLQEFIEKQPQSKRIPQAKHLLGQANLATSDDRVSELMMNVLKKHTIEEVREITTGRRQLQLPVPINNPILMQMFGQTVRRVQVQVLSERMAMADTTAPKPANPPPGDGQPEKPPKEEPKTEPPKAEPEVATKPPITDPAELLASLGLVRDGPVWRLRDEDLLQDSLTKITAHYKTLNEARREISAADRDQLAQMKRKLKADETKATAMRESWRQRQTISSREARSIEAAEAAVSELRQKVQRADARVLGVDNRIDETHKQVMQQLNAMTEAIQSLEDRFRDLQANDRALDAIEKLGSRLGRSSIVGAAKNKIKRIQKDVGDKAK